jgi:hypothetical protein
METYKKLQYATMFSFVDMKAYYSSDNEKI